MFQAAFGRLLADDLSRGANFFDCDGESAKTERTILGRDATVPVVLLDHAPESLPSKAREKTANARGIILKTRSLIFLCTTCTSASLMLSR